MKLLDALVRSAPSAEVQRYDVSWFMQMLTQYGSQIDPLGYRTTYGDQPAEPIGEAFVDYVHNAYKANGVVYACQMVRTKVFSEARFQFQRLSGGRPGELFGTQDLSILERPWPGGTTGDLLARMILDADLAGNWFGVVLDDEVVRLRPDWVDIVLAPRVGPNGGMVGMKRVGYLYYEGGKDYSASGLYAQAGGRPEAFLTSEVAHFAPSPDPIASYRGMSWLTPVVREIQSDSQATKHKLKFFENAATPNLAVKVPTIMQPDQFTEFVDAMDRAHKGVDNAYKTLYTAGGADVTVIGADLRQLDFKVVQGAGETRIANAAGVHPAVVGLSEGMQGSSLNAGNFNAAKRATAQTTMRPLWRNASGSLEMLVPPPSASRLWYDDRDIEFLREDEKDAAEIRKMDASTLEALTRAGCDWNAAVDYVSSGEPSRLRNQHSGLFSVQLQPPGTQPPSSNGKPADGQVPEGGTPKPPPAASRGRSIQRRFDPTQTRNPDNGKWVDTTPGDELVDAAEELIEAVDGLELEPGEKVLAEDRLRGDPHANYQNVLEVVFTGSPDGPRLRLAVADDDGGRSHATLDQDGIDKLQTGLNEALGVGKDHQRQYKSELAEFDRLYDRRGEIGDAPQTPALQKELEDIDTRLEYLQSPAAAQADAVFHNGTVGGRPGVAFQVRGVDDENGSWKVDLAVVPEGGPSGWTVEDAEESTTFDMRPSDVRRLLKKIDGNRGAARSRTGVVSPQRIQRGRRRLPQPSGNRSGGRR